MKKWIKIVLIVVLALVLVNVLYFFVYLRFNEPKTDLTETNRDAAVYETTQEMLDTLGYGYEEWLCEVNRLDKIHDKDIKNGLYIVPGLKATKTLTKNKVVMCTSMTPQGLTVTDKYMFISAYCYTHQHNSVMYMLDIVTGELLKTIVLPDKSHVGGLAYDDENDIIWIAGKVDKKAGINGICLSRLEAYTPDHGKPISYDFSTQLNELKAVSFITYSPGAIWAGTFDSWDKSIICGYLVDTSGDVSSEPFKTAEIDSLIQGMETDDGYIVLSRSYGSMDSQVMIYGGTVEELLALTSLSEDNADVILKAPQKMEQITAYNGKIYFLYESGALAYRDRGYDHIDRVFSHGIEDSTKYGTEYLEVAKNSFNSDIGTGLNRRPLFFFISQAQ